MQASHRHPNGHIIQNGEQENRRKSSRGKEAPVRESPGRASPGRKPPGRAARGRVPHISGWSSPLVHFSQLPRFLQDNEYLLNHHRQQLPAFLECLKSSFRLHTETWNIWTHAIPCVGFLSLALYQILRPHIEREVEHKLAFTPFFIGSVFCLGASGCFHTFLCHSEPVHRILAKWDYCGVIAMIVMSTLTWLYYGFYCHQVVQRFYISLVLLCGSFCIYIVTQDRFGRPEYRQLRAGLFITLGLTSVTPALHFLYLYGLEGAHYFPWLVAMAISYLSGGLIYAARLPERIKPGMFDVWGHSHQILHICVVAGAILCYVGAEHIAYWRMTSDCSAYVSEAS